MSVFALILLALVLALSMAVLMSQLSVSPGGRRQGSDGGDGGNGGGE